MSLFCQGNNDYWCSDLLKASEEFLSSVTLKQDTIDEELLTGHLFTVGEVAQVGHGLLRCTNYFVVVIKCLNFKN